MEKPDGLSPTPQSEVAPKALSPAKGAIGTMHKDILTGLAQSAPDFLQGRIVQEGSPEAQRILELQRQQIEAAKVAHNLASGNVEVPKTKKGWQPGHRAYHIKRKEYCVILRASLDGHRIEVVFPKGERKLVQMVNLKKA